MSTIGLDRLVYAKITEDESGNETYGVPRTLAKAIDADLSVEVAEATLYCDDGAAEHISESTFRLDSGGERALRINNTFDQRKMFAAVNAGPVEIGAEIRREFRGESCLSHPGDKNFRGKAVMDQLAQ